jgi:hypothetical protein
VGGRTYTEATGLTAVALHGMRPWLAVAGPRHADPTDSRGAVWLRQAALVTVLDDPVI